MKRRLKQSLGILLSVLMTATMIPILPVAAASNPFKDVQDSDWFFDPVIWAVANEITQGTSSTTFSPSEGCTRGQVVTFLWRFAGQPTVDDSSIFTDVTENEYYADAVSWAVQNEITQGVGNNRFNPNATCTRGQIVTFLWRYVDKPFTTTNSGFSDVKSSQYYAKPITWAVQNGITQGVGDNKFAPDDTCTRGQIVTFLYRAKDLITGSNLSDEEIEQEIETVTDLNQGLADIDSAFSITDNAQETADRADAVMEEMLDYCNRQKEAGAIVDYKQDGCLIIIQLNVGKFVYEFQPFPELQGGGYGTSALYSNDRETGLAVLSEKAQLLSDSSGQSRIITLEPFNSSFNTDIFDSAAQAIENSGLGYVFTDNMNSGEVSAEFVKHLSDYKVIIWNGHGSYSETDDVHSILGLGEICSKYNYEFYVDDLRNDRIVWFGDAETREEADEKKVHYGVTTKFFDYYYDASSFTGSLIFLGACCTAADDYLAQTFIDKGAEAVFGYSTLVHPDYNQAMFKTIFEQLIIKDDEGKTRTVKQALETAKEKNGERDPNLVTLKQWFMDRFSTVPWTKLYKEQAELILKEKDSVSYRLSDYGGTGEEQNQSGTVGLGSVNIGDYVTFGHYEQDNNLDNGKEAIEWKVLDKENGRALLLSKYGLDCKPYNDTNTYVTWETCTLRNWLNSDFLNEAFSTSEKIAIPTVTLSNPNNLTYGTEGGNRTNDRVFLLNLQEMQHYFNLSDTWTDYDGVIRDVTKDTTFYIGGSKDAITSTTTYAYWAGDNGSNPLNHDAEGKLACHWWLRSSGHQGKNAADVVNYKAANVDRYGSVRSFGEIVTSDIVVRPALWVNLAS